jgi:hypothetical protein
MFGLLANAIGSAVQRVRSYVLPPPAPPTHRQLLLHRRRKPKQPTILKRSTLRSLQYLVDRDLTPSFRGSKFAVAKSSREKIDGRYVSDPTPTYGV